MTALFLERARLRDAVEVFDARYDVFAPVAGRPGDRPRFARVPGVGDPEIEPRKTLLPLRDLFLPPCEEILTFERAGSDMQVSAPPALERDRVVLGALACDVAALAILDRVMLQEPSDATWRERRERTAIVALACPGEDERCFCASFGIDPLRPAGADALLVPAGSGWTLEILTDRGSDIAGALAGVARNAASDEIAAATSVRSSSRGDVPLARSGCTWGTAWGRPPGNEIASRCLGCGVCAAICPTCHCFEVQDESRGHRGARLRAWDTCAASRYALMASGENPRSRLEARVRQRFLHKLSYFPERHGVVACVGCGRCASLCPAGTGLEEVARRLAGEGDAP